MPLLIFITIALGLCVPAALVPVAPNLLPGFVVSGLLLSAALTALRLLPEKFARSRQLVQGLFWSLLVLLYLLRCVWVLVVNFSSEGFSDNFFAHISLEAMRVGWSEYAGPLSVMLAFLLVWLLALARLRAAAEGAARPVALLLVSAVALALLWPLGPEAEWVDNYRVFSAQINPGTLSAADRERLQGSGLVTLAGTHRRELQASLPPRPMNLVLLYLESFQLAFTDEGPLPDLTPGINRLKQRYGHHPQWLSSADATMEGLISTLCGTLVASSQGASGFASRSAILPNLTCMPDVLHEAGYQQIYMGGFDKAFSGKGLFLSDHGFDEVWGWEDWQAQGLEAPFKNWGLPDQPLFEQAAARLRQLQSQASGQPFNLTLLTLGTHPPGFVGAGCNAYPDAPDARLIQSIHCADQLLTRFVEQLLAENLLDNTLLLIVGDHDIFNLPELQPYFPGLGRDPRLLMLLIDPRAPAQWPQQANSGADLAPTVLDLLGVEHNAGFMWGTSVFQPKPYLVTRNVRAAQGGELQFLTTRRTTCGASPVALTPPLDDCAHHELLALSDQFLYSFYGEQAAPAALCEAEAGLQVEVAPGAALVLTAGGAQQAQSFMHFGRPMQPTAPGFYLYIKPSATRAAGHYYYGLDHVYRQIKLTELLLGLQSADQFVLAYLPGEHPGLIEPLQRWLEALGLAGPDLGRAFIVAGNADPLAGEVVVVQGDHGASLYLDADGCAGLVAATGGEQLLDKQAIDALLAPLAEQFPDL